jgi:hypothetical protein
MTRVDEFNSFYAATAEQTLRVMYAVTGDRQVALESTVNAYRHTWRDWSKVRGNDPRGYVRTEAWRSVGLSRGTHPLRKRHEDDSDTGLLDALLDLPSDERRLVVLMTLGDIDLDDAAREVGVTAEEGIEGATNALATLEQRLGQGIEQIEARLHALGGVTSTLSLPDVRVLRTRARRSERRNGVALVAAAVLAVVAGAFVATDGDAMARNQAMPQREKLSNESPMETLDAREVDADDLLTSEQVSRLNPQAAWSVSGTDTNPANPEPYATCPIKRFANPDPERVFVRTYTTQAQDEERVAEAIEVSRSRKAATAAYRTLVSWYADCTHPRVQLVGSYTVDRPFGDFTILRLRSYRDPEKTFTVGLSSSGTVTSVVVHEVRGAKAPPVETFAQTLNDAVLRVCIDSGGTCSTDLQVRSTVPPPTTTSPAFLGIVDLPPVGRVDKVWAGTPAQVAKDDPTTTPCELRKRSKKAGDVVGSRVFLIPEARQQLPAQFAVAQTLVRLKDEDAARDLVDGSKKLMERCARENLAATVSQQGSRKTEQQRQRTWRMVFEVSKRNKAYYRTGLVQRGRYVSQVTLTTSKDVDIPREAFERLLERAGQRLVNAR